MDASRKEKNTFLHLLFWNNKEKNIKYIYKRLRIKSLLLRHIAVILDFQIDVGEDLPTVWVRNPTSGGI